MSIICSICTFVGICNIHYFMRYTSASRETERCGVIVASRTRSGTARRFVTALPPATIGKFLRKSTSENIYLQAYFDITHILSYKTVSTVMCSETPSRNSKMRRITCVIYDNISHERERLIIHHHPGRYVPRYKPQFLAPVDLYNITDVAAVRSAAVLRTTRTLGKMRDSVQTVQCAIRIL